MTPPASPVPGKLKPGGYWYLIGALMMVAGVAALVGLIAAGLVRTSKAVDNFARFVVTRDGTEATIKFDEAGEYTVYYESQSTVDGKAYTSAQDAPPDLAVTAKAQGGADLAVTKSPDAITFSVSGVVGRSEFLVRIPAPGNYVVRATGGASAAPYVVSLGKGQISRLTQFVLGGLGLGGLLGIGGLVTLIVTASKRKAARRAQLAMGASLPYGSAGWYPSAPPVAPGGPWVPAAPPPAGAPPSAPAHGPTPTPNWGSPPTPAPASPPTWPPASPAPASGAPASGTPARPVAPPSGPWAPPPPPR